MAERMYLNNDWSFAERFAEEMTAPDYDDCKMNKVRLPHTCKETPFHYFDERIYQMVCGYRRVFYAEEGWRGKTLTLTFEGAAHESEVFLNGEKIGEHHCGYTAFSMDIGDYVKYGEDNVLAVRLNTKEDGNIPPFGYVVDYMTYGGIYRDVYLEIKNPCHLEDIFLWSEVSLKQPKARLHTQATLAGGASCSLRQYIRKKGEETYRLLGEAEITEADAGKNGAPKEEQLCFAISGVELWDIENPTLYEIKTQLLTGNAVEDEKVITFGFRRAVFLKNGFYLNGKKIKLRGLNRHQSYPYVGYAMPSSVQRLDADILKRELGLNAVRTSHYPQSHDFLDRCDELGLLVFTEIPGWQHIGDAAWKEQAVRNVEDMVKQYRNHASVILWGVRINESADDDAFYRRTNEAAHRLDPTRQTGGVRAHKKSSLLEDVYTYNDFSHDGKHKGCESKKAVTSDMEKPYLISEYNGHMYPTKAFDCEEHRAEHALRHANVLNRAALEADVAGSFGWCMADYNTHKDFGSGDRICYHGVLDMFRNPKLAAYIYASQQEKEPVLALTSSMDIGEHPGCNRGDTWILTNADSVRMYKNDRFIKEYRREDSPYKGLRHGPLLIDDFIGDAIEKNEAFKPSQAKGIKDALNLTARYGLSNLPKSVYLTAVEMLAVYRMKPTQAVELYNKYIGDWGGTATVYRFEAIKDGRVVKTMVKKPPKEVRLWAQADHRTLSEDRSYDVAAVRIRALDESGNLLSFFQEPVLLGTEGPIELIGGNVISLKGGMAGTYVKTAGESGKAALVLTCAQTGEVRLEFSVQAMQEKKAKRRCR
ncbi:MAG: glycoside hydrolase family 2 protein [Butyrivibrio sp.]|nr:glycoside hydrolase family 2 protein [Butyrivibrio sp.]